MTPVFTGRVQGLSTRPVNTGSVYRPLVTDHFVRDYARRMARLWLLLISP